MQRIDIWLGVIVLAICLILAGIIVYAPPFDTSIHLSDAPSGFTPGWGFGYSMSQQTWSYTYLYAPGIGN